jgi:hypothetical protein
MSVYNFQIVTNPGNDLECIYVGVLNFKIVFPILISGKFEVTFD